MLAMLNSLFPLIYGAVFRGPALASLPRDEQGFQSCQPDPVPSKTAPAK